MAQLASGLKIAQSVKGTDVYPPLNNRAIPSAEDRSFDCNAADCEQINRVK
jgi:hypothetical protein